MATRPNVQSLEEEALQLQPAARAALAHTLVASLTALSDDQIEELWLEEAQRRDAEIESGRAVGIPGDEVFRRLRAGYRT